MRNLMLPCACLCLLLIATNSVAQDDPKIEAAEKKAKAAWTKVNLAKGKLILAEGELGQTVWELNTLEWQRDRKPLLEELSNVERNMQAMMRMEHTLEERDALGLRYEKALTALKNCDSDYAPEFAGAWKYMNAANDWENTRDFEEIADEQDIRRLNVLRLAFAPWKWMRLMVEFEQDIGEVMNGDLRDVECETMLALYFRTQSAAAKLNQLRENQDTAEVAKRDAEAAYKKGRSDKVGEEKLAQLEKDIKAREDEVKAANEALDEGREFYYELLEAHSYLQDETGAALNRIEFSKVALEGALEMYGDALKDPDAEESSPPVDSTPREKPYFIGNGKKSDPVETAPSVVATIDTLEHCAELSALKGVKALHVEFTECEFADVDAKRHELLAAGMKAIAAHTGLEKLTIKMPFECKAEDCQALSKLKSLRSLDLSESDVTDEQMQAFRGLDKVEKVDLTACLLLGTNTIDALDQMKGLKQVDFTLCIGIPRWARALVAHRNPEAEVMPDGSFPVFEEE